MAVYKAEQITAALIMEEFPDVAAALQETPEITADFLRENHPDVVAAIADEARAEAQGQSDAAAAAERERVTAILALKRPGVEAIIDAAVADTSMTEEKVKAQLYDHDVSAREKAAETHMKDGKSLAADVKDIGERGASDDDNPKSAAEKAHEKIMAKLDKGEK